MSFPNKIYRLNICLLLLTLTTKSLFKATWVPQFPWENKVTNLTMHKIKECWSYDFGVQAKKVYYR